MNSVSENIARILHTHVIELGEEKNLVLRILDNGMVDVTIELSENECYGLQIRWGLFLTSMSDFLYHLKER